jgi:hypothetical protein
MFGAWHAAMPDLGHHRSRDPGIDMTRCDPAPSVGWALLLREFGRSDIGDPDTVEERWSYDPQINLYRRYANQLVWTAGNLESKSLFECEPDLESDLPMRHDAVLDVPSNLGDFEPAKIVERFRRTRDRPADRVVASCR